MNVPGRELVVSELWTGRAPPLQLADPAPAVGLARKMVCWPGTAPIGEELRRLADCSSLQLHNDIQITRSSIIVYMSDA